MAATGSLRAGAAKLDITPPLDTPIAGSFHERQATDVEDPLYARALVLEAGDVRLALVACDIIALEFGDVTAAKELIARRTGIPAQCVQVAATHTHTAGSPTGLLGAPRAETYMAQMPARIASAVGLAVKRLRPARVGSSVLPVEGVTFCRRFRMRDGTVRMNPGRGNPDVVEPVSPIDPGLTVLYLEDAETRQALALWANFTLHYVGTDNNNALSADYFGRFARIVESALGGQALALLTNGASGQINNVDFRDKQQPGGAYQAERVARVVAGAAISAAGRVRLTGEATLDAELRTIDVTRRKISADDLAIAQRVLKAPEGRGATGIPDAPFSWVRGQPLPPDVRHTYAREMAFLEALPATLPAPVQALRVNELAIVGLPGEIFVELGLAIKAASPAVSTAVVGLANGYLGYVPDNQGYDQGGYETWAARSSAVERGTGEALVAAANDLTGAMFGAG
jgi:neutral ceramidase